MDYKEKGKQVQKMGCVVTLMVTFPLLGLALFGVVGLLVGAAVGLIFLWGLRLSHNDTKLKEEK